MINGLQKPVLVGFFPKRTAQRPKGFENTGIDEICSVSNHISEAPDKWAEKRKHNALGFYDSEEIALSLVGPDLPGFDMYAYRLFPFEFDDGQVADYEIPVHVSEHLTNYDLLGYDAANQDVPPYYTCSALSCNAGYKDFPVNRYCLFESISLAYEATKKISLGHYEPGPWYLLEVYRKARK